VSVQGERGPEINPAPVSTPIACTLDAADVPDRLNEWRAVLAHARAHVRVGDGGRRIEFGDTVPIADLAQLAAAEHSCCSFFSFSITIDRRGVALEVRVPEGGDEVAAELFGRLAPDIGMPPGLTPRSPS